MTSKRKATQTTAAATLEMDRPVEATEVEATTVSDAAKDAASEADDREVKAATAPPAAETAVAETTPAPAAKTPAAPTVKKVPQLRPLVGATAAMKRLVISDPKASIDQIAEGLKAQGFVPSKSTIGTIRSDFIHSCRILAELDGAKLRATLKALSPDK